MRMFLSLVLISVYAESLFAVEVCVKNASKAAMAIYSIAAEGIQGSAPEAEKPVRDKTKSQTQLKEHEFYTVKIQDSNDEDEGWEFTYQVKLRKEDCRVIEVKELKALYCAKV